MRGIGRLAAALLALAPGLASAEIDPAAFARFEGKPVAWVRFVGNGTTRDYVIARELATRAGAPLRLAELREDLQRLENIGLFAETTVVPEADGDGVGLSFHFKEMPPIVPFPSFTYTEENGFSYGAAVSALNLAGHAISLSARVYFGGTDQRWAKLSHPWIAGNHVSVDFFGGEREREDTMNGFQEDSWEFTPGVGAWIGHSGRLRGFFSLFRMNADVDGKTLDPDNQDTFQRVGASVGWDTRDSWRQPRRGFKNELELIASFGSGSFWTANLDIRGYVPTWRGQNLLLSGLLTLQSGTVGEDVPGYFTYYLGGANTIRGYTLNELGPWLNGKNQLLTTVEYNFTLMPLQRRDIFRWSYSLGLQLALFADAGTAWTDASEFGWKRYRAGVGAGLRLIVPGTEQVRFDLGWSPSGGVHFHFASGTKPASQRQRLR